MVVVPDASVMEVVDVLQGLNKGGHVFINSAQKREFEGVVAINVDLNGIALRENLIVAGSPILNAPVLGALARLGIISEDSAKKSICEMFTDERNVRADEGHTRR